MAFSHVIGDTSSAADIGEAYDWNAVGWRVIQKSNVSRFSGRSNRQY